MEVDKKVKVLVVENEQIIARDIQSSLEKLNYEVCGVAATAKDAMQLAYEAKPDIALMDINIDGSRDGIETAKSLKSHFDIPIIFLTSLKEFNVIQKAKESEPFGYLIKPFRYDELQSSIEIALMNHSRTRKLQGNIEKFTSAIHILETAVIILDPEGVIDYFNSQIEELTGWSKLEKKGSSVNKMLVIDGLPAWLQLENYSEKERLQDTISFSQNSHLVTKSGKQVPAHGHISSFQNTEGEIAGYIIVIENDKPQKAQDAAEETNETGFSSQIVNNFIFLKDKSSLYRIQLDQITYVEALGNYVKVHTGDKKHYTALIPLKDIEKMLPEEKFFRMHRSFIVALDKISAIHSMDVQVGEVMLPIGKTFRDDLLKRIQVI